MRTPTRLPFVLLGLLLITGGCAEETEQPQDFADTLARAHEADTPQANVFAMEPHIPVTGGPVTYGTAFSGYEVWPEQADSIGQTDAALPGVLLIHEWWGLNDNIRAHARQLAGEGYRVLAVDLFGGRVAEDPQTAQGYVQQAMQNERVALENLEAAYTHLTETRGAADVAVMGYCFGGGMALNAALALPEDLDALVIYYGQLTTDESRLEALDMPVLGIFGSEDEAIPVDQVRAFEEALNEVDAEAEIHVFEGADHAFANPSGAQFQEEAAREAWDLTRDFLSRHLQ